MAQTHTYIFVVLSGYTDCEHEHESQLSLQHGPTQDPRLQPRFGCLMTNDGSAGHSHMWGSNSTMSPVVAQIPVFYNIFDDNSVWGNNQ